MGEVIDFMEYKRRKEEARMVPELSFKNLDEFLDHMTDEYDAFNADGSLPEEMSITMSVYSWANLTNEIIDLQEELEKLKTVKKPLFRKAKGFDAYISNIEGGAA